MSHGWPDSIFYLLQWRPVCATFLLDKKQQKNNRVLRLGPLLKNLKRTKVIGDVITLVEFLFSSGNNLIHRSVSQRLSGAHMPALPYGGAQPCTEFKPSGQVLGRRVLPGWRPWAKVSVVERLEVQMPANAPQTSFFCP